MSSPTPPSASGQTVALNGVEIYYERHGAGDGPPVLLLHGGTAHSGHYAAQVPALAAVHPVILMDSRGHGRSSIDDTPMSYAQMARDTLALLDYLDVDRASIVGWSDGGIIALDISLTHPERLHKVVAYGTNYNLDGIRNDETEATYSDIATSFFATIESDYRAMSPHPDRYDAFLADIMRMWRSEPNYTADQLRTIATPFLVLDGEEEESINLDQVREMAELIPGAELVLMPGTGHFAQLEQPAEFNRIVLDYLAR